ncbi:2-iminobutanoate/2-iminopropanoate deaminase [Kitasatospora sp. MAA4]|uniref:RidA family protein n=1 Tax=Kitasatospora sp. MAA4 TaxID=3035093 RepID=UPI002475FA37|nr:RidA family protein [Kitasatospora sp. MAA4]MDH6137160.1 2-iminobutanoate/2-iminopropanoate deaminase [Kitasatospora sp. MAA4]
MSPFRETVSSPELPVHGPYSPAVRAGNLVFVSAQPGVDPATGTVPDRGAGAQCRQALRNLEHVLRVAGAELRDVVRTTVFYTDLADLPAINSAYAEAFPLDPPARSAAVVSLAGGRLVSIDAIAALG